MEDSKKWWSSKTIWVNMLMAIVAIVSAALPDVSLLEKLNEELFLSIFAGVNMILRFVTKDSIEFK
jgi:hypothetical protein